MPLEAISLKNRRDIDALLQKLHDCGYIEFKVKDGRCVLDRRNIKTLSERLLVDGNGETYLLDDILNTSPSALQTDARLKKIFFFTNGGKQRSLGEIIKYFTTEKIYTDTRKRHIFNRDQILHMTSEEMDQCKDLKFKSKRGVERSFRALHTQLMSKVPLGNVPFSEVLHQIHPEEKKLNLESPACSIGQVDRVVFPVITIYGHNYEAANLEQWLQAHSTCPVTRGYLNKNRMMLNRALRDLIWVDLRQRYKNDEKDESVSSAIKMAENRAEKLRREYSQQTTYDPVCVDLLNNDPDFKNKSLPEIVDLENTLKDERTRIRNTCSNLTKIFTGMETLGFLGGFFSLCFIVPLIAVPVPAIVTGILVVSAFMIGIIGNKITEKYSQPKTEELDQRLATVRKVKSHLQKYGEREITLADRVKELDDTTDLLSNLRAPQKYKKNRPAPSPPLLYKNRSTVFQPPGTTENLYLVPTGSTTFFPNQSPMHSPYYST